MGSGWRSIQVRNGDGPDLGSDHGDAHKDKAKASGAQLVWTWKGRQRDPGQEEALQEAGLGKHNAKEETLKEAPGHKYRGGSQQAKGVGSKRIGER